MSGVRKCFGKQFNLSIGVLELITKSWSEGTTKQYAPHLRRWFSFCSENELHSLNADVSSGAEFLINISENLVASILQSTQLVQFCHLFSQQSMDLRSVNNL